MVDEDKRPWLRSWKFWVPGGFVALFVVLLIVGGGGDDDGPDNGGNTGEDGPVVDRDQCRRQLTGALEALQPTRLGISSSANDLANSLNIWWADCGAESRTDFDVEADSLESMLTPEVFRRVVTGRYDARDVEHLRDCLLFRRVAQEIGASFALDLDRAVAAFEFAVRQVSGLRTGSRRPAMPCVMAALFGRADPRQRAWLFAEVLRQLSIDCVVVESAGDEPSDDWLVGAIVEGEGVFLFDPSAGIAIPGSRVDVESADAARPATLREVRDNDDLLRRLDAADGATYPWTAERFQQITVKVIGDSAWWSPRMARLQQELPAEFSMTVFDGLTDTPYRSVGLLDRVREAGADGLWDVDDVLVWEYPEAQSAEFHAAGGEEGAEIAERMRVLRAPRLLVPQEDGVVIERDSSRPLRMVRMQHLSGAPEEALRDYGTVRSAFSMNPVIVNELAKEDAVYWIALCQYEMGRDESAISTLDSYLSAYPAGVWLGAVRSLRARCLARLERYEEAAEVLVEKTTGGSSLSFGEAFLLRQWQAMGSEAGESESNVEL